MNNTTAISPRVPGPESLSSLTAFCATCPDPQEVSHVLQEMGFHLAFFLAADDAGAYMVDLPPLPAQYHFEDEVGTRIEYLAGPDTPCLDDDEDTSTSLRFPPHASRFWLTPGGQELATICTRDTMAVKFSLCWLDRLPGLSRADAA